MICTHCGVRTETDSPVCPNCGAPPYGAASSSGFLGPLGGAVGGCFGVILFVVAMGFGAASAANGPHQLFYASVAVVAVIVVPIMLPYGRRIPAFLRWFIVAMLLTYLGVFAVCSATPFGGP